MTNEEFLELAYQVHLSTFLDENGKFNMNETRSTKRLEKLHGDIAKDLQYCLDKKSDRKYLVISKGIKAPKEIKTHGEEAILKGRYAEKHIDISVFEKEGKVKYIPVAAFELKFPNRSYAKNANNNLESLLGNTANIRSNEGSVLYFHIDLLMSDIPKEERKKFGFDKVNENILEKFIKLSQDNTAQYFHSPTKELLYLMKIEGIDGVKSYQEYGEYVRDNRDKLKLNHEFEKRFSKGTIVNNYEEFIEKAIYAILAF